MDISSYASFSSQLSQARLQEQVELSALKSAQDMAAASVLQLLDSVAQTAAVSTASSNPNVGVNIDLHV